MSHTGWATHPWVFSSHLITNHQKSLFFFYLQNTSKRDTPHQFCHYHPGPNGIISCLAYYNNLTCYLCFYSYSYYSILIPTRERSFMPDFIIPANKALQRFHITKVEASLHYCLSSVCPTSISSLSYFTFKSRHSSHPGLFVMSQAHLVCYS